MQLKRNRQSEDGTGKGRPETPVPQNILDCVRSALSPYITSWDKVQDAIMSSGTEDQLTDTEEETFLSTEDVSKMLHVSRTTLHRYKTAGKIRVFKEKPTRKGQLNHCSPAEPEQHFETKALECCSFSPIVRPWSSGNRGYEKILHLNKGCQSAGFSLRSWKNRGKSSKTAERRVVSHLKGRHWGRIWEGKVQRYPDRDTVFHGPASWDELEGWTF